MATVDEYKPVVAWQFGANGSLQPANSADLEWTPYETTISDIIENAFQERQERVVIGDYYIDFTHDPILQISKYDKNCKTPVRRQNGLQDSNSIKRLERFSVAEKPKVKSMKSSSVDISPFIAEWIRRNPNHKFKGNIVELLATGLAEEARLIGKIDQTKYILERIQKSKGASHDELAKLCVIIYTEDTWIYKTVNAVLREEDMTKVDTLGPFCYLVHMYLCAPHTRKKGEQIVYRSMNLKPEDIEIYKESVGQVRCWLGFSSTSRNRAQAFVANTLFIIRFEGEISQRFPGREISNLSTYPTEEEVLLYPGADFRVEEVEENVGTGRQTIVRLCLM
ncbi:unnamed protein product [Adineta ricciae]|uniref:WWE domain-containing protein n=1 Tax=Adineta ricciae TaxID=249248 RepID=A0A814X5V8_ADIRI|nr:unnamed protein product [Adineta ricciae]CAF1549307.1 unnamed protein product [Adineta ricciae]